MFRIEYYDSLESTNDYIKSRKNEDEGLVIVAKSQTNGRGQGNNKWVSEEGGLYFSILLKPEKILPALSIMTGWVVLKTLETFGIKDLKLKWSNDILHFDSKISGVLIESKLLSDKPEYIIIGCGINVNQSVFQNVNEYTPTSMYLINNEKIDLKTVLNKFLDIFKEYYFDSCNNGDFFQNTLESKEFKSKIYKKDEVINIQLYNGDIIQAVLKGIDKTGGLIISDKENNTKILYSGRIIK